MRYKCLGLNIFLVFLIVSLFIRSVISKSLPEYINVTSDDAVKNIPVLFNLLEQAKKNNQPQKIILCLLSPGMKTISENDSILHSGVDKKQYNIKNIEENTNSINNYNTKSYMEKTRNIQLENNIMSIKSYNATLAKKTDLPETKEVDLYDDSDILTKLAMKLKKSKTKNTVRDYLYVSEPELYFTASPSAQRTTETCSSDFKKAFEPKILYKDAKSNLPENLKEFIEQNQVLPKIGCAYESKCFGATSGDVRQKGQIKPVKLIAKIYKEEPITDEVKQFAFYLPSNGEYCEYKLRRKIKYTEYSTVKYPSS